MIADETVPDTKPIRKAKGIFRRNGGVLRMAEAVKSGIHRRTLYAMRDGEQARTASRKHRETTRL